MKTFIIPAALLLSSCAPEFALVDSDVPQAVKAAFDSRYPGASDVKWEAEQEQGRLYFEAEFAVDGKEREAYFRPDGTYVKEEDD